MSKENLLEHAEFLTDIFQEKFMWKLILKTIFLTFFADFQR